MAVKEEKKRKRRRKRREEDQILRRASEMVVEGVRPRGRPKKTWKRCVEEDMREMNIREEAVV